MSYDHTDIPDDIMRHIDSYVPSRPIFEVSLSSDARNLHVFNPKQDPISIDLDIEDPLTLLVKSNFTEKFIVGEGAYKIDKHHMANRVIRDLINKILSFIEKNQKLKNPMQGALYKYYRSEVLNKNVYSALISVYRWMSGFVSVDDGMRVAKENAAKADTAIAILETIRKKYSKNEQ